MSLDDNFRSSRMITNHRVGQDQACEHPSGISIGCGQTNSEINAKAPSRRDARNTKTEYGILSLPIPIRLPLPCVPAAWCLCVEIFDHFMRSDYGSSVDFVLVPFVG